VEGFGDDVAVGCEAFGNGVVDSAFVDVHDGYEGAAGLAGHGCDEEADGASTDDEGG